MAPYNQTVPESIPAADIIGAQPQERLMQSQESVRESQLVVWMIILILSLTSDGVHEFYWSTDAIWVGWITTARGYIGWFTTTGMIQMIVVGMPFRG